jgi:hypothetical protein
MRFWRKAGLLAAGASVVATATACVPMHALSQPSDIVNPNAPTSGSVGGANGAVSAGDVSAFLQARQGGRQSAGQLAAVAAPTGSDVLHATFGPDTWTGDGEFATQSVRPDLTINHPNDRIYAPTMKPAGGSCIEVVTAYSQDGPAVWAWDWCEATPGPAAVRKIDRSFLDTYTANVNGQIAYTTNDMRTNPANNTWTAQLYNYRTRSWETLWTSSGTDKSGDGNQGWDMFEVWSKSPASGNATYCANAAGHAFDSSNIQILIGGSWQPVNASNSQWAHSGTAFDCRSLSFRVPSPNNHWTVQG